MKKLLLVLLAVNLWGQNPKTAVFPTRPAVDTDLFVANNQTTQKTLATTITSSSTSIVLSSGTGWVAPVVITIDRATASQEIVYCSTLTSSTLSGCVRGQENTSATSHTSGANIDNFLTEGAFNQIAAEIKATESALAARTIDYVAGGGTAQAQTATLAPPLTALTAGARVRWIPSHANTAAAPTLAVNGLTAKSITKLGATALVANDITAAAIADVIYDGTEWQLQNPQTGTGGGNTLTSVTFSSTPTFTRSNPNQEWSITLTGNVTSSSLSGASAGDILVFNIIQDATGGRTFAWPTGFGEACTIASAASIGTKQTFYWDGSAAHALTPCVTTAAAPGAGILRGDTTSASELSGDATTSGSNAVTNVKVNGIAYSATAAAHSVEVVTTANTTATPKVVPDCTDTGGNHINFTQSTDAFSCGTSGGGSGVVQQVTVNISSAQIKTLNASPVTIVAAQGAGTFIQFVGATVEFVSNGTQYTTATGNVNFTLAGNWVAQATSDATINGLTSTQQIPFPPASGGSSLGDQRNVALDFRNTSAPEFAAGNGTFIVKCQYIVLTGL